VPPRTRKPAFNEQYLPTFEELKPQLKFDAEGSDTEWLKPEYHGLKTQDFTDLRDKDLSVYGQRLTTEVFDSALYRSGNHHPALFPRYSKNGKKVLEWVAISPEEAFHLGRHPSLLDEEAVQKALETERVLDFPPQESPTRERWKVINAYRHQHIRRKLGDVETLYDTMRLRDSNGKRVQGADRIELAKKIRLEVFHPVIDTIAIIDEWSAEEVFKTHQAMDVKLFFEGTMTERKVATWKPWLKFFETYLKYVDAFAHEQTLQAKQNPETPALQAAGRLAISMYQS
jgi:hypothetical protein